MQEKEFNLIHEPWLRVLDALGEIQTVSLQQLFAQAHMFKGLAGEIVTQDVAVLRFLLGILYAVFGWKDADGKEGRPQNARQAALRWQALWDKGAFPQGITAEYLKSMEDRFYLFHPQTPFMQVMVDESATVKTAKGVQTLNPASKEIRYLIGDLAESENTLRLFSARQDTSELSYGEAARWLLHMNAFDVSPGGAPPREGFRANGYKLPWPHTLGLVWAEGDNLFETLMLNFVLAPAGQDPWEDFLPAWEGEEVFRAQTLTEKERPFPQDPSALYTFPFRLMQLVRNEEGAITSLILWGGRFIDGDSGNVFTEGMSLWQMDKAGKHKPRKHNPARQMWRDLSAILPSTGSALAPGVVQWISQLKQDGHLQLPLLRLRSAGTVLAKSTSLSHVYGDSLRFHLAMLNDLEEGHGAMVRREIALADQLVRDVGRFASDLTQAGGGSGEQAIKHAREKAMEQAYHLLDLAFRPWLESLDEHSLPHEAGKAWREEEFRLLLRLARDMVLQAGNSALVGRRFKLKREDKKEVTLASPLLYRQLSAKMYKKLQS